MTKLISKIENLGISTHLEKDEELISLLKDFGEKISIDVFNLLSKVNRWETKGLVCEKKETNKEHVLEMLSIAKQFLNKHKQLNEIIDIKTVYIKIILHDLGEIGTGDYTTDQQLKLTEKEKKIKDKKERRSAIAAINFLKNEGIDIKTIEELKKYYLDYEKNKSNPNELNDYFVKFIDKYQALIFIIDHIPEFKNFEKYSINTIFQELKERNIQFKNLGFDLLENCNEIISYNKVDQEQIKKCIKK